MMRPLYQDICHVLIHVHPVFIEILSTNLPFVCRARVDDADMVKGSSYPQLLYRLL